MPKKYQAEVRSIKVWCEKLDEEIEYNLSQVYFICHDDPCELCGSHGEITVDVYCKCGKTHTIKLEGW